MSELWLVFAVATAIVLATIVVALRGRTGPPTAADGLLALGPILVVLGILFGDDRLIGYTLIGAGVVVAVWSAWERRHGAST